jgi:hypothetical protein
VVSSRPFLLGTVAEHTFISANVKSTC